MEYKTKQCRLCNENLPISSFTSTRAKYCNNCLIIRKLEQQKAMQQRAFERMKNKKQKKQTVIRISDLKKEVQRIFNKWIRERDKDIPCISCGKHSDKVDAGHFIAQGSSGYLRYHEGNVHKQCKSCNRFKHGNLLEYRINLVKKIGQENVEWLENHRNKTKKWTREELNEIKTRYKLLIDNCK